MQRMPAWARFQWINDDKIVALLHQTLPYAGTGRRGVGKGTLFRWLLYKQCHGCTYRDLESISGIDYTTFIKFRKTIRENGWLEYVFHTITTTTTQGRRLKLITDSSFVEQYARHPERGAEYSGFKEKTGFKVHQIIDFRTRLPVAKAVTGGARADVVLAHQLVTQLPRRLGCHGLSRRQRLRQQCVGAASEEKMEGCRREYSGATNEPSNSAITLPGNTKKPTRQTSRTYPHETPLQPTHRD